MPKIILSCLLFVSVTAFAQNDAARFATSITPAALKEKLTVIAGAGMEGRETATPGQKKAAAYIETYFKKIGLQPGTADGYQLIYPVYQDTLEEASMNLNGRELQLYKDYYLSATSFNTGFYIIDTLVFASYGLSDSSNNNLGGLNIKNKWVMVIDGTPADMDRKPERDSFPNRMLNFRKIPDLRAKGAKGIIVISRRLPEATAANRKGSMYTNRREVAAPVIYITPAAAFAMLKQPVDSFINLKTVARRNYPVKLSFSEQKNSLVMNSSDVIGVLPGTDKADEYVFVTGHYDHLGKRGKRYLLRC